MNWVARPLADCASFISGGTPNKGNSEYWGGDIPWVSSGEMAEQFIADTSLRLTSAGLQAGSRLVPAGTTFVVVRGMSLATQFRVCYATKPMAFNQDVKAAVVSDGIDPYFFFSSLRANAEQIRDLATEAAHGTKKLEMERLLSFSIRVPALKTQLEVVALVKRYDDLIENNRRRIALLEESARLLYREWFVDLRFPGHETRNVTGGLPTGWAVQPLAELATVNRASLGSKNRPERIRYIDIASVQTGVVSAVEPIDFAEAPGRARRLVQHGDVIWSCVRPNRRSFALLWEPDSTVVVSTGFAVLTATAVPFSYLYFATTSDDFVAYLTNRATGAAYPAVSGTDFEEACVLGPGSETLQAFDELCLPMLEMKSKLLVQNERLTETRNALLPKLMSGEIAV